MTIVNGICAGISPDDTLGVGTCQVRIMTDIQLCFSSRRYHVRIGNGRESPEEYRNCEFRTELNVNIVQWENEPTECHNIYCSI